MAVRNVRDKPGAARPSRVLQASAKAELVRKTGGAPAAALPESPAAVRQRARTQRIQGAGAAQVAKVYGNAVPADVAAAEAAAGMDSGTPFSPGGPLAPYDGFSRTPRQQNFTPQYNVSARPRTHERVSFDTLRGLIEAYDIAQIAIWHRIDSIRSLEWSLVAADGYEGDVSDAVALGMSILRKPDGETPFGAWLGAWLYDILAYDAGALYRMRNRAGRAVGLMHVDGTTLAPLLDDWGRTPKTPAPAYVQYVNGLPWNWLTTDDVIYRPFRKVPNSPYGRAPLESILLNANTDLRFQAYFLQRFTEGNLPAAFASAPETWTPAQIEQFQEYWDGFILGDQAFKSQIRWIPPGSKIEWSNEKDFTDSFSLHLLRKTFAAYHVVPSDSGFTQEINKSSGETQSDVQHRIGDVPLAKHVDEVITSFLQDDVCLPLKFQFDFGEEQDDRYATAQADDLYIKNGTVSNSDIRELRFGLSEPEGKRTPRFIYSNRSGPVPLSALEAVAGPIDQESGAPEPGAPLPHTVFQPVEGVEGNPPTPRPPLAVEQYGPGALPVAAPQSVPALPPKPVQAALATAPVAKDGEGDGAPTAGITAATGITSYDLVGRRKSEDDEASVLAKELAAYRTFVKDSRRRGRWRDFRFNTLDAATARTLNEAGRHAVMTKASGTPGLTKRSGMISLDLPAGLVPTIPGGVTDHHITVVYLGSDVSDTEFDTACDRAQAAAAQAPGPLLGTIAGIDTFAPSDGSDGKIPAFVPVTLPGVEHLRAHLEDLSANEHADYRPHVTLAYLDEGDPLPDPVPATLVSFTHLTVHRGEQTRSFPLGPRTLGSVSLAKAVGGDPGPKADASAKEASSAWPGSTHDRATADYWARYLDRELGKVLTSALAEQIARDYAATEPGPRAGRSDKELTDAAATWLATRTLDFETALAAAIPGIRADGALIGAASAHALLAGRKNADLGNWKPGRTDHARKAVAEYLPDPPDEAEGEEPDVAGMAATRRRSVARALALGTAAGLTAAAIGKKMRDALSDGLDRITLTEIIGAISLAAIALFRRNKVHLGRWNLDPARVSCPACITNADADPRPLGRNYPSGHPYPPAHISCGCWIGPA